MKLHILRSVKRPWPTISIVIPSYNYGRYIQRSIDSVLKQEYPYIQLIVIDGASTDSTMDVLDRYRPQLDVCLVEPDAGQTDAINKGFRYVRGELFNWLNADDELIADCLLTVAKAWRRGSDLIIGQSNIIREQANKVDVSPIYRPSYSSYLDFQSTSFRGYLPQPAVFISTALARNAFPLSTHLRQVMDYQLYLRVLRQDPRISLIQRPVANFYYHGANMSLSSTPKLPELIEVCEAEIAHASVTRQAKLRRILRAAVTIHSWLYQPNSPKTSEVLAQSLHNPYLIIRPLWWKFLFKSVLSSLRVAGRRCLRVVGHSSCLRFGLRDRIIRWFHNPDCSVDEAFSSAFYGGGRYDGNFRSFIDWSVYYFGAYSKPELDCLAALLLRIPNAVVLDIGANVGNHTLFLSRRAQRVIAFEPYPVALDQLQRHLDANYISNVSVVPCGLSDRDDVLTYRPPSSSNQGVGAFLSAAPSACDHIRLQVRQGDALLNELQIGSVDLIKIDTEGFEAFILHGLSQTLEHCRPLVFFEWSSLRDGGTQASTPPDLFPAQYRFYRFSDPPVVMGLFQKGGFRLDPLPAECSWPAGNYLACPSTFVPPMQ